MFPPSGALAFRAVLIHTCVPVGERSGLQKQGGRLDFQEKFSRVDRALPTAL